MTAYAPQGQAQEIAPATNHFFGAAAMAVGQTSRANIASVDDPEQFPAGTTCGVIINYFAADGTLLTSPFRGVLDIDKTIFVDLNRKLAENTQQPRAFPRSGQRDRQPKPRP